MAVGECNNRSRATDITRVGSVAEPSSLQAALCDTHGVSLVQACVSCSAMGLPTLRRCCGCLSLEAGCLLLCVISTLACVGYMVAGAWNFPRHREREHEDNLISMTAVMFSALSAASDLLALCGLLTRRAGCLQLALLSNSVFTVCLFLVAGVTCLFSPELAPLLRAPTNIALVVLLLLASAAYSIYYLMVINSLYRKMKMYSETALPMSPT